MMNKLVKKLDCEKRHPRKIRKKGNRYAKCLFDEKTRQCARMPSENMEGGGGDRLFPHKQHRYGRYSVFGIGGKWVLFV
jgi:hypothetical protein